MIFKSDDLDAEYERPQAKTGVEVTYAELAKHLGPNGANMLSRTVWKDGIDIEVPIIGIQSLVNYYVDASLAAERAEAVRVREALKELRAVVPYFWDDDSSHIGELDAACGKADEALK